MKQLILAVTFIVLLSACTAGVYTGGGWTEVENIETHPSFGFTVDTCHDDVEGVFNFVDPSWSHPVHMTGHILNFGDLDYFQGDCNYYALLEYDSTDLDEEFQGSGHAVACFTDDETHVLISVQSGPYKGYESKGVVHGVMVHHECEE